LAQNFQLVKLVEGNAGSKRITIPKEIVQKMKIEKADYVAIVYEEERKASIFPVTLIIEGQARAQTRQT